MVVSVLSLGRLIIPTTLNPPLKFLPPSLYTILLSIPAKELSRKPPRPPQVTAPNFSLSTPDKLAAKLDSALSLDGQGEDVFGGKRTRAEEEEESGGWLGFGTDLETLKVVSQELEELDLELGLFGGLKVVDVSPGLCFPWRARRRTKKDGGHLVKRELTFVFLPSLLFLSSATTNSQQSLQASSISLFSPL